jgi:hypothetical protein
MTFRGNLAYVPPEDGMLMPKDVGVESLWLCIFYPMCFFWANKDGIEAAATLKVFCMWHRYSGETQLGGTENDSVVFPVRSGSSSYLEGGHGSSFRVPSNSRPT